MIIHPILTAAIRNDARPCLSGRPWPFLNALRVQREMAQIVRTAAYRALGVS